MDFKRKKKGKIWETWLVVPAMFLLGVLSGCSSAAAGGEKAPAEEDGKLQVVTTLFPYYDFTRQVAGDLVDLSMVIPAGMDSHSFEPTPADIRLMQNADVLICNGGAMEVWVDRVLDSFDTSGMIVVTMMDYVDVVEEELVEGMEDTGTEHHHHDTAHVHEDEEEHDEGHVHEDGEVHLHEDEHDHSLEDESQYEIEYDEHIWTSPVNAMKIVEAISETLQAADAAHAGEYRAAAEAYQGQLEALDQEFRQVVAEGEHDIIIMGDKFPLRYFADEYGLRYRAAFSGCSTDTEPSAKTIAYLIDKVREEQIPAVYYLELSSSRVAEIIGEETGAEPLLFHSCHNVTRREFENGVTYLELMEGNVVNLRKGLGK